MPGAPDGARGLTSCPVCIGKMASRCSRHFTWLTKPRQADSRWSWVVCIAATISQSLQMGVFLTFGVVFPVIVDHFNETRERTAWIGSLGIAMTYVGSPVAGCIVNRFGCRATILTGGFLCITGLALTSFAPNIYVMYLTLSCITGFGGCCIFMASFLIVPQYFHNRRSLATGIVASGTGLGVLVMAPVIQALLDSVGLSNTYRVLAAVFLTVIVLGCTFQPVSQDSHDNEENTSVVTAESSAPKERPAIKLLDLSVWKVPAFTVITVSVAVGFFGHSVPRIHLIKFARELGFPSNISSQLFVYQGLCSCITRIVFGRLCDTKWVNVQYLYQLSMLLDGLSAAAVSRATLYSHFVVYAVFFGIAEGGFVSTMSIILLNSVDPLRRTSAFGFGALAYGTGIALGGPTAGFIVDQLGYYSPAFYLAASVMVSAAFIPFLLRCFRNPSRREYTVEVIEL